MEITLEKDCSALGGLFQTIVNDMKSGGPVWEDFVSKATKLHSQLRSTLLAASVFLESFQKIADMATNTRGATKELGTALTRMCMRHKSIESKMKQYTCALMDCLVVPLQERLEEWKKVTNQLDKDHMKEYKRARQEIKKKSSDTLRLQKKARKGKGDVQNRLDSALQDVTDKFYLLEEAEKSAVRSALIEERGRYCFFVSLLKPVVDEEVSMLTEVTHLQSILDDLTEQSRDPHLLPAASEQVITDLKGTEPKWAFQTPPSSPGSAGSHKSSMCSLSSLTSCGSDGRSSGSSSANSHSPGSHFRYRSISQPQPQSASSSSSSTNRLSSISSQDSGFTSQDALFVRPATPPPNNYQQAHHQPGGGVGGGAGPSSDAHSSSECSTPSSPVATAFPIPSWSNWTSNTPLGGHPSLVGPPCNKPPLPEKPLVTPRPVRRDNTILPSKPVLPNFNMAQPDMIVPQPVYMNEGGGSGGGGGLERAPSSQPHTRVRSSSVPSRTMTTPQQFQEEIDLITADLDMALARGLGGPDPHPAKDAPVDQRQQRSEVGSRNSLQTCSSGYYTQPSTPSCSEDTIASQDYFSLEADRGMDSGGEEEFSKPSTIPRSGDVSHCYRQVHSPKRPASTTGIPAPGPGPPGPVPGGTIHSDGTQSASNTLRRAGSQSARSKPPPPVRRTNSVSLPSGPASTPAATATPAPDPAAPPSPPPAGGTSFQQAIAAKQQQILLGETKSAPATPHKPLRPASMAVVPNHAGTPRGHPPHLANGGPSRASVIESLNQKFSLQMKAAAGRPGAGHQQQRKRLQPQQPHHFNGRPEVNQGAEVSEGSLLHQIKRGTSLRSTRTNDRSSPHLT